MKYKKYTKRSRKVITEYKGKHKPKDKKNLDLIILLSLIAAFFIIFTLSNPMKMPGFAVSEELEKQELEESAFINFVIELTDAKHLDSNKNFISNIYNEIKELDNIWSRQIFSEEYIRITFEEELDNTRDITIYPRIVDGNPRIEVYEVDGTELIAEFRNIISNEYNKVLLTNLVGEQDVFDLRIVEGSLEFEHIIDPESTSNWQTFTELEPGWKIYIDNDPKQEVDVTAIDIGEGILELTLFEHENSTTGGGYKWDMAVCGDGNKTLKYANEDTGGGFENAYYEIVNYENLVDNGMNETWCDGGEGFVLFSAGSKNQFPKKIRLNTSEFDEFIIYAGTGSIVVYVNAGSIVAGLINGANNISVACPEYVADDILIISSYNTDGEAMSTTTSGWAKITSVASTDDAAWFWKRATGSGTAGAYIEAADDDLFAICYVIRGTKTIGNPFDSGFAIADNLSAATDTATPTTMPITTLGSDRLVMHFLNINDNVAAWDAGPGGSGGWVLNDDSTSGAGSDARFTVISRNVSEASVVPSVTVGTLNAIELQAGLTIAFIPINVAWNQTTYNFGEIASTSTGTVKITAEDDNTNVAVDCTGDCSEITSNWSTISMSNGQVEQVLLTCDDSSEGTFQAVFNVISVEDTTSNLITVDCIVSIPDNTPPTFTTIPANVSADYLVANVNADFDFTDETAISMIFINDTSNFTMTNSTGVLTNNTPLFAGSYALNVTINDSSNNINWTIFTVVVNQIAPQGSLAGTASITYGTQGDVTGSESNSGDGGVSYKLYRNGTEVNNPDESILAVGFYSYIYNATSGQNYTANASMDTFDLTVSQSSDICGVEFNETSPLSYPKTFLVWSNCSSANYLVKNGTVIENNSEQSLGIGAYNFSTNRTDIINYSHIYSEREFRIVDTTKPTWTDNQTNQTIEGLLTIFAIKYNDNLALESNGGYIFSTNNSGVWVNDSLVMWTSTPEWANVTKTLPANTGNLTQYRWFANDSAGNINNSDVFSVTTTSAQDLIHPYFTTIPSNVSADYLVANVNADFDATDAVGFGGFYLNDTSNFTIDYSTGVLTNNTPLFVGNYALNVTINDTSLNINWTIFTVVVAQIAPQGSLAGTASITYGTPGNVDGTETNTGDADVLYKLYRNGTEVNDPDTSTLAVGFYSYIYNASAGYNYTANASMDTFDLTVSQNSDICGVYFNTSSPITFPETFIVYTNCSSAYTLRQNGGTISNATTVNSGVGAFNFSVQRTDTVNYSSVYSDEEFSVSQSSDICGVQFNETSPLSYPKTFLVWSNCSSANYLMKNGTIIANNSEQSLGIGAYNFSTNRTDTVNYSHIYSEREFRIVDNTKPTFTTIPANVSADYLVANVNADFDATDAVGFGGFYLNDTSNFTIDYSTGVLTNKTSLFADSYALNITINDTSLNINWTIFTVVVNQIAPQGSLAGTASITYETQGDVTGSESNSGDGGVSYKLYRNGTEVNDPDTSTLAIGFYSYIYNATGSGNYTDNASMDTFDLTVTQNADICGVYFNTSSPITFPETFIVYTNCSTAYTLYMNETSISNASTINSGAGAYNLSVQRTDTVNYSDTYNEEEFQIAKATGEVATHINEVRNNKSELLNFKKWLNATLITGIGDIELYYNGTLINQGASPLANLTNLTQEGEFNVSAIYGGNANYTSDIETWWVTVSSDSAPTVSIIYPTNMNYPTDVTNITYTADDDIDLSYCWYSLNNGTTNSSFDSTCANITELSSNQGSNTWTVYANDSIGQESLDFVIFTKDTIYPNFTSYAKNPTTPNEDENVQINVTITEANIDTVIFEWASTTNYTVTTSNGDEYYFNLTSGNYTARDSVTYYWYSNDTAGNMNKSAQQSFTVANQVPTITVSEPDGSEDNTKTTFNVTWTASDNDDEDTLTISCYGDADNSGHDKTYTCFTGKANDGSEDCDVSSWEEDTYYIWCNATDTYSSTVDYSPGELTIDKTGPSVGSETKDKTPNENQDVQLNATITAAGVGIDTVWINVSVNNGAETKFIVTLHSGDEYYFTLDKGNYTAHDIVNWTYHANDTLDNLGSGTMQSFTVANQIPTVSQPAINTTTPYTNDLISCNDGTFSDDDAEDNTEQARYFKWYDTNIEISGQTSQTLALSVSDLDKGDVIKCSVRVYDGYDNSSWQNSSNSATIQNSAPTIDNPQTTVSWNANESTYTYDYEATDADEDSFTWYDNTTLFNIDSSTGEISDTPTEAEAGTYAIEINVSDGTVNATDIFLYTINDPNDPIINFVDPTVNSGETVFQNYIEINVTATDSNLDTIAIRLYNSTRHLIKTNSSASSPFNITYSSLSSGLYFYNVTANDTESNSADTETRNITLNADPPTLTIINPKNETYITKNNLPLDYSANGEDFVWYNIDGDPENTTLTGNTTFNVSSEGSHTLYLYANNSNGETVRNITFTVNSTQFIIIYDEFKSSKKGDSTDFNKHCYEDMQNMSSIILEHTDYGKIEFNEIINLTNDESPNDNILDLDSNINISDNRIELNSTALPNFDKNATLYFYGLDLTNPRVLRDTIVCPSTICTSPVDSSGTWTFNVTGFTVYSLEETPSETPYIPPSSTGGSSKAKYECSQDSDCEEEDQVCLNHKCVKLFDIKIINFESPVKLGEFFEFTYLVKGMANISGDVEVFFWIEKMKESVTSGSDVIYIGYFEEKIETTKIFLPNTIDSGVYQFFVKISYGDYTVQSHRTIEIEVKDGLAKITPIDKEPSKNYLYYLLGILVLAILIILIKIIRRINWQGLSNDLRRRRNEYRLSKRINKYKLSRINYVKTKRKIRLGKKLKKIIKNIKILTENSIAYLNNYAKLLKFKIKKKPRKIYKPKRLPEKLEVPEPEIKHEPELPEHLHILKKKFAEDVAEEVKKELPKEKPRIKIIKPPTKPIQPTKKPEEPLYKPVVKEEMQKPQDISKEPQPFESPEKKPAKEEPVKEKPAEDSSQDIIENMVKKEKSEEEKF